MFVREKRARGHSYLYLVENEREGGRVRQRIIRALGRKNVLLAVAHSCRTGDLSRPQSSNGLVVRGGAGLHRERRSVVVLTLIPVAIGHLASLAVVAGAFLALGVMIDGRPLLMVTGGGLIVWAVPFGLWLPPPSAHRHAGRVRRPAGMVVPCGERSWRRAHANPGDDPALLFGRRGERRDGFGRADHLARRSRHSHGSHGDCQRKHCSPGLRLDRGGIPAARLDQFGLAVDGSARRHGNDLVRGLSPE